MGRIERSSGWLFPAFITVFWFGALFVALMTSEKSNNRVLIFALLVGVVFIVNLLRKLNIMSLLAFERRAVLVLPPSSIKAGDDFEILFRQELKRNHTVISVDATLYGEIVDNRSTEIEYRIPHIQKLFPDKFLQEGKLIEARRKINIPEHLPVPSEYKSLPVGWRILVSVKLHRGPKCNSMFYLPTVGVDGLKKGQIKNLK